jgi:GT2 family glycosyltransferase
VSKPKASVIVLTWNALAYLEDCLDAVLGQDYADFEVIVVDNGSTDGSVDFIAQHYPQARLFLNKRNLGFAAGNNVGLRAASGELLVLLNADTQVHPGWLAALADAFDDPSIGVGGCKLLYPDGSIQHAGGFTFGPRGEADHLGRYAPDDGSFDKPTDVEYATGAALAIRRTVLNQIGFLDESFYPIYYEDVDWCYRARAAGFRVVYVPAATVTHYESTTFGAQTYERKFALHQGRLRFLFKHRPADWLLGEFGPVEKAWIASMDRNEELMAVRHGCLVVLSALPGILAFRSSFLKDTPEDAHALVGLLTDLRTATVAGLAALSVPAACQAPPLPTWPQPPSVREEATGLPDLHLDHQKKAEWTRTQLLSALEAAQTIQERPFTSNVPVLGRLIVAIRSLWNSVSTKWYVRPLIQQQIVFNAQVVGYLRVLQEQATNLEQHGEMIGWLSRRADQLEEWSAKQEFFLSGQVRDVAENIRELTALAERAACTEKPEEGIQT